MTLRPSRRFWMTVVLGLALTAIFAALLVRFRADLHEEVRRTVIGRDAAVLRTVTAQRLAASAPRGGPGALPVEDLVAAVQPGTRPQGALGVAVFDAQGNLVRAVPGTLLFAELSAADYLALLRGRPLSRFDAAFPLDRYFSGARGAAPVLEVLLPLEADGDGAPMGFVQYLLDARELGGELGAIETRLRRQTVATLAAGVALIGLVLGLAHLGLSRAQRLVEERNVRLARANFELNLAAKTSALGQITSHLIHGLQGSLTGLQSVVATGSAGESDWASAAVYTQRMQGIISEIIELLSDADAGVRFELGGDELAATIRSRSAAPAAAKGVELDVVSRLAGRIDSHRGGLLCLIAANLVQNAITATPPGAKIFVELAGTPEVPVLRVRDEGEGIPASVVARLFEPGVSGRVGGSGLGLAISRLLARQIGCDLTLESNGPRGAVFCVASTRG